MSKTAVRDPSTGAIVKATPKDGGWGNIGIYFIALCIISVCLAPVLYIVLGGFRTSSQITTSPAGFPNPFVPGNYWTALTINPTTVKIGPISANVSAFWAMFINSAYIAIITVFFVVLFGVMASFVLARYKFRLRNAMYLLFASGLMFPLSVAITPLYIMMTRTHLAGSPWSVILPQVAFGLPQTIIILTPFLAAIPMEIEEAATVDGCTRLGFFWRMVVPLSMPGVITVAILNFVGSWNSYMLPLYMFSDQSQYTLPLGVQMFSTAHSADTAQIMAFTSLSMIPALVFFLMFEKRIVGGLTGAVKG